MAHGKPHGGPNQGSHAEPHTSKPRVSPSAPTVNHVCDTPAKSSSRGVHTPGTSGKGTVGKPGATPKPGPLS